jgi:4-amino-4-deoxy-L-arabinose transferase-like glycosyltransferase
LAVSAVLLAAVALLLATSPIGYDFVNSDSPRHALNGAFVLDAVRAFPWRDPMGYAADYYIRYPSLSIGFYPPLFYMAEAVVYAVIGVSHFAAQLTVALFTLLLAGSAYRLGRIFLSRWPALAATLLLLGAPVMALWSRQVMLDIPAAALLMLAVLGFARYLRRERQADLWLATLALVAALYIKFTVCFVAVPLMAGLIARRGVRSLIDRRIILAAIVALVLALPAAWLTYKFGSVNLDNLNGRAAGEPIDSLDRWTYYLRQLPDQLGWLTVLLAVPGSVVLWRRAREAAGTWLPVLLTTWFVWGYLFFSAIRVHEARHDLMILFPVILAAVSALTALPLVSVGMSAGPVLGGGTLIWSLVTPVPRVEGYAAITREVAAVAPPEAIVLFSAFRDGNFVFAMRAIGNRPDIKVLRANKWLLRFAVDRHWGVGQAAYDQAGLAATIHDHGIAVAVAQRGFWVDLQQMALLQQVLRDPANWRSVASMPISGDLVPDEFPPKEPACAAAADPGCGENTLDIVLPLAPPVADRQPIEFDLPFLNRHLREHNAP